jgi:Protein of unknown function (DUF4232)
MQFRPIALTALLAAVGAGAAGCGGATASTATVTRTQTTTVTESTTTPLPQPATTASQSPPRCQTSQLDVQMATNGAAGSIALWFTFTNHSRTTCTLYGYPGFGLLDGAGAALPTHVLRKPSVVVPSVPERRVTLAPRGTAHAYGGYSDVWPTTCRRAAMLEVTPPDAYRHLTIRAAIAPCGGVIHVSPVFA